MAASKALCIAEKPNIFGSDRSCNFAEILNRPAIPANTICHNGNYICHNGNYVVI